MSATDPVVAVLVGDLHFSHAPPLARSHFQEVDWYGIQKSYLLQLAQLASRRIENENGSCQYQRIPILCSGDVVDHWRQPPELVNFLLENMPTIYAVPGQHDTPYHSYEEIKKSAYWTLVQGGRIINLEPGQPTPVDNLLVHGFPWRFPITPYKGERLDPLVRTVCVAHAYIWTEETGFEGAPEEKRLRQYRQLLEGYDLCLFGDNHQTIHVVKENTTIFNPGTFMRRHITDLRHRPCAGLLHESGRVRKHYFDISKDRLLNRAKAVYQLKSTLEWKKLVRTLNDLGASSIEFLQLLMELLETADPGDEVRQEIMDIVEKQRGH